MNPERHKYPRTPHLPWSTGRAPDDVGLESVAALAGLADVVVTEKLDGENTSLARDFVHARSPDYAPHPTRDWVVALHARIRHQIPAGFQVCEENLFARHSIGYTALPGYLLVFGLFDGEECLSWDDSLTWCCRLDLPAVPELYRGPWDEGAVKNCQHPVSLCGGLQEGYVVRNAGAFAETDFQANVAKFVRPDHVCGSMHWQQRSLIRNRLARTTT